MSRILSHARNNLVAYIALFIALGGSSYAAISLPAGSVGTRQLKNRSVTAAKLDPSSVAASVRAWATLVWAGRWHVQSSTSDIHVTDIALGEDVSWRHTRFPRNCMASVTPIRNPFLTGATSSSEGFVATSFDGPAGDLAIESRAPNGTSQLQSVNVLIVCPNPGSQEVSR